MQIRKNANVDLFHAKTQRRNTCLMTFLRFAYLRENII